MVFLCVAQIPVIVDWKYLWGRVLFILVHAVLRQKKAIGEPHLATTNVLIVTTSKLIVVTSHLPYVTVWLVSGLRGLLRGFRCAEKCLFASVMPPIWLQLNSMWVWTRVTCRDISENIDTYEGRKMRCSHFTQHACQIFIEVINI